MNVVNRGLGPEVIYKSMHACNNIYFTTRLRLSLHRVMNAEVNKVPKEILLERQGKLALLTARPARP
jgi:hypothetical protein